MKMSKTLFHANPEQIFIRIGKSQLLQCHEAFLNFKRHFLIKRFLTCSILVIVSTTVLENFLLTVLLYTRVFFKEIVSVTLKNKKYYYSYCMYGIPISCRNIIIVVRQKNDILNTALWW